MPGRQGREAALVEVPSFSDERGTLAVIELARLLPFHPARFYYVYELGVDARRGGHAHWLDSEAILALGGAFTVTVDSGDGPRDIRLDRPDRFLHVPPGIWHELHSFAPGSICAVFASRHHDEKDYCRDYSGFLRALREERA